MAILLTHDSALEFWQTQQQLSRHSRLLPLPASIRISDCRSISSNELAELNLARFGITETPVHLLIPPRERIHSGATLKYHEQTTDFPPFSIVQLSSNLYVVSPACCLIQYACKHEPWDLARKCIELCGDYVNSPGYAFPICSAETLQKYLSSSTGARGHNSLARILPFIANGSASPLETALFLLLRLPNRLGGCAFPPALFNHPIELSGEARILADRNECYCDLFFPESKLAIEYDSDANHSYKEALNRDARKRNALSLMGIETISVTSQQIYDCGAFDALTCVIARKLGRRMRIRARAFELKQAILRQNLLPISTPKS